MPIVTASVSHGKQVDRLPALYSDIERAQLCVALFLNLLYGPCERAGEVPEWLSGKLFRLGPGKWELGGGFCLRHWFDGAAILSAFEIHKGKFDVNKLVSVNLASAHPITQEDGTSYNLGASFVSGLKYHIIKIPPPGKGCSGLKRASVAYHIPSSWKTTFSYYHSFGMTRNYVVFVEQPLLVNAMRLVGSRIKGYSFKDCLDWAPKEKTKFVVLDRSSGAVLRTRFVTDPLFFFHVVNTYEDDGHIVFDMIAYEDATILDRYYLDKIRNSTAEDFDPDCQGHFRRFVIPVSKVSSTKEGNLVSLKYTEARAYRQDNSTIWLTHEEMGSKGKPYRYTYGSGNFERLGECRNAICKLDIERREMQLWRESDTQFPSEAVFVANPEGVDEDDGVLLSVVNDTDYSKPDFLLVLDAKTLTELARAQVPPHVRACTSIHGCFVRS
ncbi:hypothetical protein HPB49_017651 [Dermacentor silvarum]|uniref:Uncharacterized protein n=1 Tax=Dermacentor silvarum TaxID=543639 RepID=A0ACB8D6J3_DERSI|nr:hypothetical protein HPB49_017651 [Dermacentor silvarum]